MQHIIIFHKPGYKGHGLSFMLCSLEVLQVLFFNKITKQKTKYF
jgi:hypothetical protein